MPYPLHKWPRPGDVFLESFLSIKCINLRIKIRLFKGKKRLKWFKRQRGKAMRKKRKAEEEKRRKGMVRERKEKQGTTNEGKCDLMSLLQFIVGPDSSDIFPREVWHPELQAEREGSTK